MCFARSLPTSVNPASTTTTKSSLVAASFQWTAMASPLLEPGPVSLSTGKKSNSYISVPPSDPTQNWPGLHEPGPVLRHSRMVSERMFECQRPPHGGRIASHNVVGGSPGVKDSGSAQLTDPESRVSP